MVIKSMKDSSSPSVNDAAGLLLLEATARIVKNELNRLLRLQMRELKLPLEVSLQFTKFLTRDLSNSQS